MNSRIHFIAIGGALMHNLAIALHQKGDRVSGSDDEIYDPSRGRLLQYGLLPEKMGWDADRITTDIDIIILGMHAKKDNPELQKALELGIPVFSYPAFLYEQSKNKIRVVVGGSHGKTSTTSMIMHALRVLGVEHDYAVGAQLEGFDCMVRISDAPIIVIEGDEYLSSPLDHRSKFIHYKPHIAILTGIAWDHINVFPDFELYVAQFKAFIERIEPNGSLIYFKSDSILRKLVKKCNVRSMGYDTPTFKIDNDRSVSVNFPLLLEHAQRWFPLKIFGAHNLQNLEAARHVIKELGFSDVDFLSAMSTFEGASKRLEKVAETDDGRIVFKDFAHAPSKVKATVKAVKKQFKGETLIAFLELHTFSSLNKNFLRHYKKTMKHADIAIVYYDQHTLDMKKMEDLDIDYVKRCFAHPNMLSINDREILADIAHQITNHTKGNVLLMSSGNWSGIDLVSIVS